MSKITTPRAAPFGRGAAFALFVLLLMTGCQSRLRVEVEVLDNSYWVSPGPLAARYAPVVFETHARLHDGSIEKKLLADIRYAIAQIPLQSLSETAREELTSDVEIHIARNVQQFRTEVDSCVADYLESFEKVSPSSDVTLSARHRAKPTPLRMVKAQQKELALSHVKIMATFHQAQRDFKKEISSLKDFFREETPPQAAFRLGTAVNKAIADAAMDSADGLRRDPNISLVVAAPDRYWTAPFDGVRTRTTFGNSDVAIKALDDSAANFTLKGLRLDASQATTTTLNVARASIHTIAKLYGVGVPQRDSGKPQADPLEKSSYDPSISPGRMEATANRGLLRIRIDQLMLLEALLARRGRLLNPDPELRAEAVDQFLMEHGRTFMAAPSSSPPETGQPAPPPEEHDDPEQDDPPPEEQDEPPPEQQDVPEQDGSDSQQEKDPATQQQTEPNPQPLGGLDPDQADAAVPIGQASNRASQIRSGWLAPQCNL